MACNPVLLPVLLTCASAVQISLQPGHTLRLHPVESNMFAGKSPLGGLKLARPRTLSKPAYDAFATALLNFIMTATAVTMPLTSTYWPTIVDGYEEFEDSEVASGPVQSESRRQLL